MAAYVPSTWIWAWGALQPKEYHRSGTMWWKTMQIPLGSTETFALGDLIHRVKRSNYSETTMLFGSPRYMERPWAGASNKRAQLSLESFQTRCQTFERRSLQKISAPHHLSLSSRGSRNYGAERERDKSFFLFTIWIPDSKSLSVIKMVVVLLWYVWENCQASVDKWNGHQRHFNDILSESFLTFWTCITWIGFSYRWEDTIWLDSAYLLWLLFYSSVTTPLMTVKIGVVISQFLNQLLNIYFPYHIFCMKIGLISISLPSI